jgi:hypothetical protein
MARVADLLPGDLVTQGEHSAVHIAHQTHPYWTNLQLVIWRLDDGTISLDALDIRQDVGEITPADWPARQARLLHAINPALGGLAPGPHASGGPHAT